MTSAATESFPSLSSTAAVRIRGLRAEAGYNQTQLARLVGLSRTAVSDREAGVKPVNIDELPDFAQVLGTSIEYLLGLTNDRSPRQEEIPAGAAVRHQGLEPRTRWISDRLARRDTAEPVVRLVPGPMTPPSRPTTTPAPAAAVTRVVSLEDRRAARGTSNPAVRGPAGVLLRFDRTEVSA